MVAGANSCNGQMAVYVPEYLRNSYREIPIGIYMVAADAATAGGRLRLNKGNGRSATAGGRLRLKGRCHSYDHLNSGPFYFLGTPIKLF